MLLALRIENFALIDSLHLELGPGLNVLTGETGAGKSIILDAIAAVLGGKVSGRAVRTGAAQATLEATFQLTPPLIPWLAAQGIPQGNAPVLVCSREILANPRQRNRLRLNGMAITQRQGEELRDRLVDITAQGQTLHLGQPSLQREWLDSFGGPEVLAQRQGVTQAYGQYQQAQQALERQRQAHQDDQQQLDLWQYQLQELEGANLEDPQELDQLLQEHHRLSHTVELQHHSYQVYQALYQNDQGNACADLLGTAEQLLGQMGEFDSQVQPILELVATALAHVEEAGRQINLYGENLEADPERLQEVERRLVQLKQICRKYGPTLGEAIAYYQTIRQQMEGISLGEASLEALEAAQRSALAELQRQCQMLTQLRQRTAQDLETRLVAALKPLAMERVQFQVQIQPQPPASHGADHIQFRFSPNPGEPLQPLGDIASGGEMSRFLLALKACFSQVDPVDTLIFDEIDVGVSGRVSQAIAHTLHDLSQRHQVLCVTHQPLIAARADRHFRVRKVIQSGMLPPGADSLGSHGGDRPVSDNSVTYNPVSDNSVSDNPVTDRPSNNPTDSQGDPTTTPADPQKIKGDRSPDRSAIQGDKSQADPSKVTGDRSAIQGDKSQADSQKTQGDRSQADALDSLAPKPGENQNHGNLGGDRTLVQVELLEDWGARQRELAELAGGESAHEALTFAESLLNQAGDRRLPNAAPRRRKSRAQPPAP